MGSIMSERVIPLPHGAQQPSAGSKQSLSPLQGLEPRVINRDHGAGQMQTDVGLTVPLSCALANISCTAKPGLLGMLLFLINK